MIKYIEWGQHLRLGNWLFLYVGLQSMMKESSNYLELPDYFLWKYLEHPPIISEDKSFDENMHFKNPVDGQLVSLEYSPSAKDSVISFFRENKDKIVNIFNTPNLQSEQWFIENLEYVKNLLKIKDKEIFYVKEKFAHFFNKKTIGVGIRRGDFVNHSCFYQIPETWYQKALEAEFPDWQECNIIVFSDDIEWCKQYYSGKGFLFAEPNNTHTHADNFKHYHNDPMEQFILGSQMDHFVGGSSTFTWWQMWYVKNFNNGKVVHSGKNLTGKCAADHHNPNYYPDNWVLYNT